MSRTIVVAPVITRFATVAAVLVAAAAHAAPKKTLVAPVQGALAAEVADEITEQARAGAMSAAPDLELLVMSKKTFDKLAAEHHLVACKDAACDVASGKTLSTLLVVATKVLKADDSFVMTVKLFDTATGKQLAVKSADAASSSQLIGQAAAVTDAVLRAGLGAPSSPANAPAPNVNTLLRDGPVAFGMDGDLLGKNGVLMLYPDRLVFQMTGLNFNNKRIEIALKDVDVVRNSGDEVQIAMSYGRMYRITSNDNATWSSAIEAQVAAAKR